jgi:hypothetical protein
MQDAQEARVTQRAQARLDQESSLKTLIVRCLLIIDCPHLISIVVIRYIQHRPRLAPWQQRSRLLPCGIDSRRPSAIGLRFFLTYHHNGDLVRCAVKQWRKQRISRGISQHGL